MTIDELASAAANSNIEPGVFTTELWRLSTGHSRTATRIDTGKAELYRSRVFVRNERPKHTRDLSYPPLKAGRLGRANTDREQIFYGSAGMPTTLGESRVQAGQYLIYGRWTNTADILLQSVGFDGEHVNLEKLYHDLFTSRDEDMYKYSSLIASHLMTGPGISGLLYPSIANQNQSHNVALTKQFVDSGLRLRYAAVLYVKSRSSDSIYEVEEVDFGKPDANGTLVWAGRRREWNLRNQDDSLEMRANGWEWEAFLPDGTYVDPE
jgi:hypothetical protein